MTGQGTWVSLSSNHGYLMRGWQSAEHILLYLFAKGQMVILDPASSHLHVSKATACRKIGGVSTVVRQICQQKVIALFLRLYNPQNPKSWSMGALLHLQPTAGHGAHSSCLFLLHVCRRAGLGDQETAPRCVNQTLEAMHSVLRD